MGGRVQRHGGFVSGFSKTIELKEFFRRLPWEILASAFWGASIFFLHSRRLIVSRQVLASPVLFLGICVMAAWCCLRWGKKKPAVGIGGLFVFEAIEKV